MRKSKILNLIIILCAIVLWACQTPTAGLQPGSGYVDVKGGKIWYGIVGEGNETPILFLHGGPGGTSKSFYLFESLSQERPLILMDQLGSGKSDFHEDTTLLEVDQFVAQVKALTTALDLKAFYLQGHSWGTALALEYYTKHPEGVEGIIFNSPYFNTALWEADADTLIKTLPDSIQMDIQIGEETQDFTSEAYLKADTVFAKNFGLRTERLKSPLDTVESESNSFIYNYMWGPTEFTAAGTLKQYDNLESLKQVKVPVLFITGEFDEARPATVAYFQTLIPGSQFEIVAGAGHATMHDNLEQNTAIIRNFLNQLEEQ